MYNHILLLILLIMVINNVVIINFCKFIIRLRILKAFAFIPITLNGAILQVYIPTM